MGISGLLPLVRDIERPAHVRELRGRTVAVDAYVWLHRGAYACAAELVAAAAGPPGTPAVSPDLYCGYALSRVRLLRQYDVVPLLVFDGGRLPSKQHTEASRAAARHAAREAAVAAVRSGDPAARELCSKAVDITPAMARSLMDRLAHLGVEFLVAPYEADAQMAFLERVGLVDAILSEDSDLLVYGTRLLLTKLQPDGSCLALSAQDLHRAKVPALGSGRAAAAQPVHDWASAGVGASDGSSNHPCAPPWADARQLKALTHLRHAALLSGCDYLPGLAGIGLRSAATLIRRYGSPARVVRHLLFEGKISLPTLDPTIGSSNDGLGLGGEVPPGKRKANQVDAYLASFRRAELTFLHQRVWDPRDGGKLVCLAPLPPASPSEHPAVRLERDRAEYTIGPWMEEDSARGIARGELDPMTHEPLSAPVPFAPTSRLGFGPSTTRSSRAATGSQSGTLSFYKPSPTASTSASTLTRKQRTLGSFFTRPKEPPPPPTATTSVTQTPSPIKPSVVRPSGSSMTTPVPRARLRSRFFPKPTSACESKQASPHPAPLGTGTGTGPSPHGDEGYWGAGAWRTPQARSSGMGETQVLAESQLLDSFRPPPSVCGPAATALSLATQTKAGNEADAIALDLDVHASPRLDGPLWEKEDEDELSPSPRAKGRHRPRSASISSLISEPVSDSDENVHPGHSPGPGLGTRVRRKRSASLSSAGTPTPRSKRVCPRPEPLLHLAGRKTRHVRRTLELGVEDWSEDMVAEIEEYEDEVEAAEVEEVQYVSQVHAPASRGGPTSPRAPTFPSQSLRRSKEEAEEEGLISSPCSVVVRSSPSPVPSTSSTPDPISPATAKAVARRMLRPTQAPLGVGSLGQAHPPSPVDTSLVLCPASQPPSQSQSQGMLIMQHATSAASPRTEALFARRRMLRASLHARPQSQSQLRRSTVSDEVDLSMSENEDLQCGERSPLAARHGHARALSRSQPKLSEDDMEMRSSENMTREARDGAEQVAAVSAGGVRKGSLMARFGAAGVRGAGTERDDVLAAASDENEDERPTDSVERGRRALPDLAQFQFRARARR